ncbi:hypothetical protein EI94DRAFT_1853038 [Lactarius quietus]|nr:hypothetical protein EI94DRAFT_1853038 [Lactarius quietus]
MWTNEPRCVRHRGGELSGNALAGSEAWVGRMVAMRRGIHATSPVFDSRVRQSKRTYAFFGDFPLVGGSRTIYQKKTELGFDSDDGGHLPDELVKLRHGRGGSGTCTTWAPSRHRGRTKILSWARVAPRQKRRRSNLGGRVDRALTDFPLSRYWQGTALSGVIENDWEGHGERCHMPTVRLRKNRIAGAAPLSTCPDKTNVQSDGALDGARDKSLRSWCRSGRDVGQTGLDCEDVAPEFSIWVSLFTSTTWRPCVAFGRIVSAFAPMRVGSCEL